MSLSTFKEKGLLQGDMALWMIFLCLCMISVVEVYSASSSMTYKSGSYWQPVMEHAGYIVFGILLAWGMHLLPCKIYKISSVFILFISWILLVVAFFSGSVNGASRWISIFGKTIQPSELAKLGLVVTCAAILSIFRDENGTSKMGTKLLIGFTGFTLALIITENLSTAALISAVIYIMAFYAQVNTKLLAWAFGLVAALAIGGLTLCYSIPESTLDEWAQSEGVLHRVPTWVHRIKNSNTLPDDPNKYDITENIQVTHAHIAIGTCGVIGRGPGNSIERDFLPQAYSDFIYAIIIEEGGILMGVGVMFLYLLLLWRAMKIASKCKGLFPAYLIMGLAVMIVIQAMMNMAVAVGAMPVTGQPLPLISRGGTSTFVNCAYMGMMLAVSRNAKMVGNEEAIEEQQIIEEQPITENTDESNN
ncbi:MAG: FtsW/RodA/SpoVE family cell cycle protein [Bacteroidaceae bacterium]|nr:FtsW/RodA/SpoVE family cell cycle protein [Bacteroidaceae bacterium]